MCGAPNALWHGIKRSGMPTYRFASMDALSQMLFCVERSATLQSQAEHYSRLAEAMPPTVAQVMRDAAVTMHESSAEYLQLAEEWNGMLIGVARGLLEVRTRPAVAKPCGFRG